jgi:hypothetical protein
VALIRAAERWRGLRITELEQRRLQAIHDESDKDFAARNASAATASRAARPNWADLAHIDGVLRLLGKDFDPEVIRPRRRHSAHLHSEHNELSRPVPANLRTAAAGEPIDIEAVSRRVVASKGFDAGEATLRTIR